MKPAISRRNFVGRTGGSIIGAGLASVAPMMAVANVGGQRRPVGRLQMTTGGVDFQVPNTVPRGQVWHYGLVYPFQVAERKAAVFCNIRSRHGRDSEAGTDVILFDRLDRLDANDAVAISRNHKGRNPNSKPAGKPAVMVKYPVAGGFVPLGARRNDGSAHPHAGSGFGIASAMAWKPDMTGRFDGPELYEFLELYQFTFDGDAFKVVSSEMLAPNDFLKGLQHLGRPISNAIPDGDDLLLAISVAKPGERRACGVSRWKKSNAGWRLSKWRPITAKDDSFEPTLIRDTDGGLLLCARGAAGFQHDIRVWRSADGASDFKKVIHAHGAIGSAPISINLAPSGPFIASNLYEVFRDPPLPEAPLPRDALGRTRLGGWMRDKLCFWPLNEQRNGLEPGVIVRNGAAEFGRAAGGHGWKIDHPSSYSIQLADGQWRSVMGMRVADAAEVRRGADPTPHTGAYLEEVVSEGKLAPVWSFT